MVTKTRQANSVSISRECAELCQNALGVIMYQFPIGKKESALGLEAELQAALKATSDSNNGH